MIKNLITNEKYVVSKVLENTNGSMSIALDRMDGIKTTSVGYLMDVTHLQHISDKYWDRDDLTNEVIAFMELNLAENAKECLA